MRATLQRAAAAMACVAGAACAQAPSPGCSTPESREFDFWVGEWDVKGGGANASNRVSKVLDGCAILEEYSGSPLVGRSFSTFEAATGLWHQTWVDNFGRHLEFVGGLKDGRMELMREMATPRFTGTARLVWRDVRPEGFTWVMEQSTDRGVTWKPTWTLEYVRRK